MKAEDLVRDINRLKRENRKLRKENGKLVLERGLYRDKCVEYFKWILGLLIEDKKPSLKWVIKDLTQLFNKGERFYIDLVS